MKILGIETSCDETAAAVIEGTLPDRPVAILTSTVASSQLFHQRTGGVVPEVASREQMNVMLPVLKKAVGRRAPTIDAIAVTAGPGLVGSLLVGVETARVLSFVWEKPLIPVNHLVAHLYANWVGVNPKSQASNSKHAQHPKSSIRKNSVPEFPAVGLVASGGHTDLVFMRDHHHIEYLGGTRDDAAGEAFDKIARFLGLGYPGGPAIEKAATHFLDGNSKFEIRNSKLKLPRPMIDREDYDCSFSGLKTAVLRIVDAHEHSDRMIQSLASEVQEAIVDVLVTKVMRAVGHLHPKSVLISGGVAANLRLRERMAQAIERSGNEKPKLFIPPAKLCTDNAVSAGACAFYRYSPTPWKAVGVDPGRTILH